MPQGYFLYMKKVPGTVILIHSLAVLVRLNHSPIDHSEEAIICVTKMRVYESLHLFDPWKRAETLLPTKNKEIFAPCGVDMH